MNDAGVNNRISGMDWSLFVLVMLWITRNSILMRRRPGDVYATIDTFAFLQIAIVALILVILVSGYGPIFRFLRRYATNLSVRFYFLYYVLSALSAFWSLNPAFSFYRALEVLALSSAVLIFCTNGSNTDENIRRTRIVVWSTVLMLVMGMAYHGSIWNLRNNTLSAAAAITASFFMVWVINGGDEEHPNLLIQGGLGLLLTIVSLSLASWWSFWFGLCYGGFFTKRKGLILFLILLGSAMFFALGVDTRKSLLLRDKEVERLETLSGRTMLWEHYSAASRKRPLLGFGFNMGAREVGRIYTTNTHNAFYGALLGTGWVGVSCGILFFISLALELIRYGHFHNPAWLACAAAIAAGSLNSMSLSIIGEQWNMSTTVFVAFLGLHLAFIQEGKERNFETSQEDSGYEIEND